MRGHILKRSKNSWDVVISAGVNPTTGKRLRYWKAVRGTKRDAEAELTKRLAEYDRGIKPVSVKVTVDQYLTEWLDEVAAPRNRPTTVQTYRGLIKNHIVPVVGSIKLEELTAQHVGMIIARMRGKSLSETTIRQAYVVLSKALSDAERRELVIRNVARLIDPPQAAEYKVVPPEWGVVEQIIRNAPSDCAAITEFMALTGVRRGEAVAIKWSAVDWDHRAVLITETAQRLNNGRLVFGPPKSSAGKRAVALDDQTLRLLREHRAAQETHILSLGGTYSDTALVFARPDGNSLDPDRVSRAFRVAARSAGYEDVRLHDLRHAHATELMAAGVNPKIVKDRLGHATTAFTLDRYSHVTADLQHEAIRNLRHPSRRSS